MTPSMKFKRPAYQFRYRERSRSILSVLFRGFCLLVLLAVTFVLVLLAMGIPASWIREIQRRLPESSFAAEVGTVSYDLFRGVMLRDVNLYRKGDVGPPLVSAETVRLNVNPLALMTGGDWLEEASISGGTIRWREGAERGGGEEAVPDFGRWNFALAVEDTRLFDQRVESGPAQVSVLGSQVRLTQAHGDIGERTGPRAAIQGEAVMDAATRRYSSTLTWSGDPLAVESLLLARGRTTTASIIRQFRPGTKPPNGDLEMEGALGTNSLFTIKVSAAARDCTYRGVAVRQAFVNMQFRRGAGGESVLSFDPVVLIREDGLAAGGFSVDFDTGDIRFDGYSTCPPAALAGLVAPAQAERVAKIRVEGPVRVHAGGTANFRDYTRNSATLFFDGQKIGASRFLADRFSFTARLTGTSIEIHDISGDCYGGSFTGAVDLVAAWTPDKKLEQVQFALEGGCQDVDWRALANATGMKAAERYEGRLSLAGRISGVAGEDAMRNLRGAGWARVKQGRLFRFPLFGPLSGFLSRLIPGFDPTTSLTDASADWRVEDGAIRSDSIAVGGDLLNLTGHGSFALTNSLDYTVQVKLLKPDTLIGLAVRALPLPVSKLFEFRLRGATDRPHWYPVNFSSDVFDRFSFGGASVQPAHAVPEKGPAGKGGPDS